MKKTFAFILSIIFSISIASTELLMCFAEDPSATSASSSTECNSSEEVEYDVMTSEGDIA